MPTPDKWETRLIVTDTKSVYEGTNRSTGAPYTIYQVQATKEDGSPITGINLRSFEELPKHEVLDVSVELFHSQQYGDSYTIKRLNAKRGQTREAVAALTNRVAELERQVAAIQRRLDYGKPPQSNGPAPSSAQPEQPVF